MKNQRNLALIVAIIFTVLIFWVGYRVGAGRSQRVITTTGFTFPSVVNGIMTNFDASSLTILSSGKTVKINLDSATKYKKVDSEGKLADAQYGDLVKDKTINVLAEIDLDNKIVKANEVDILPEVPVIAPTAAGTPTPTQ